LARLGFQVSARTVAKCMRGCRPRGPTGTWRQFLTRHASNMWSCDFFCVPTVLFQTLDVFFVIRLANREVLHVAVTRHPTADWAAQQIVECCAWDRAPPRFLIHDRDSKSRRLLAPPCACAPSRTMIKGDSTSIPTKIERIPDSPHVASAGREPLWPIGWPATIRPERRPKAPNN
jgi:hypothetical protein